MCYVSRLSLSMTKRNIKPTCATLQVGADKLREIQKWLIQLRTSINRNERSEEKDVTLRFY